jgi:hypothetical protein
MRGGHQRKWTNDKGVNILRSFQRDFHNYKEKKFLKYNNNTVSSLQILKLISIYLDRISLPACMYKKCAKKFP